MTEPISAGPPAPITEQPIFEIGEFEWIEKAAVENLKQRVEGADVLAKESSTTLTILLAGIGGSLAYAVKLFDGDSSRSVIAAVVVCGWLTVCAMVLVFTCLRISKIYLVYNEPGNLLCRQERGASFDQWRRGELKGMQERIRYNTLRNEKVAARLNLIRIMAALSPLIAAASFLRC